MSKTTYTMLALVAAIIGLASSWVTGQFFMLGLSQLESDPAARQALLASGLLMIVVELAAFGLAALLPSATLHALRGRLVACGLLLLAFEAVTIYATQVALVRTGDTAQAASQARVDGLVESIKSQRMAVSALRDSGARQSASNNAWAQHLGAKAIQEALQAEQRITPMVNELASLQATIKPTMSTVLGNDGMLIYNVARSLLTTGMGLLMFGAAGALLRAGRETVAATVATPYITEKSPAPDYRRKVEKTYGTGTGSFPALKIATQLILATVPAAQATPTPITEPTVANNETSAAAAATALTDERYNQIKAAIASGAVKPSVRALHKHIGGATLSIRDYLAKLEMDGVTVRTRRGWELAQSSNG